LGIETLHFAILKEQVAFVQCFLDWCLHQWAKGIFDLLENYSVSKIKAGLNKKYAD